MSYFFKFNSSKNILKKNKKMNNENVNRFIKFRISLIKLCKCFFNVYSEEKSPEYPKRKF